MKSFVAAMATGLILISPTLSVSAQEYEITKGDTLWGIAKEHDTSVETLLDINNLKSDLILPEQKLELYKKHKVEKGDTLYAISKKYGTTVDKIKEWNELESDLIKIGQELVIKEDSVKEVAAAQSIKPTEVKSSTASKKDDTPQGQTISVVATAYTADCAGCTGITYTGINLNKDRNAKVIAVDPSVIPLGSKVYVEGYGYAIAGDIGGAIKGNRIDIHLPTKQDALDWGVKEVKLTIVK